MKAAVIGVGPHGRRVVQAIEKTEGLDLVAVVDRSADALEALEVSAEVLRTGRLEDAWAQKPELVCITTNGPSHAELVLSAIDAGAKRVMVEKPMGCSLAECDRMIDAAEKAGVRLLVNNSRRYEGIYRWVRDRMASGDWGELRAMWIERPGIGLGCLGVHSFDLVHFLSGVTPTHVTGWVDESIKKNPRGEQFKDPGGLVVMSLPPRNDGERGARAVIAQLEDAAGPTAVEIHCTAARVRIDEKMNEMQVIERDLSVIPGPGRPPKFELIEPPDMPKKPNLHTCLAGLLEELMSDAPITATGDSGRDAIEVLVGAYVSNEKGNAPVQLPLTGEDRERWLSVT